jgi:hypothetical protein
MSNEKNEMNTVSNMEQSKIQLKDGTVLNLNLNGTEYESETPLDKEFFSEENLEEVIINDVNMGKMALNSVYDFNGGTRFSLRELTEDEKTIDELRKELARVSGIATTANDTANKAMETAQLGGGEYAQAGRIMLGLEDAETETKEE